jgi:hypothetical protein
METDLVRIYTFKLFPLPSDKYSFRLCALSEVVLILPSDIALVSLLLQLLLIKIFVVVNFTEANHVGVLIFDLLDDSWSPVFEFVNCVLIDAISNPVEICQYVVLHHTEVVVPVLNEVVHLFELDVLLVF